MQTPGRLVRAEIDLTAFSHNLQAVRKLIGPITKLMIVVKGNAYGHGIVPISQKALSLGVDYFGVVCLYEARQLRNAGITKPILLLNYTDEQSLDEALDLDLSINVMDEDILHAVSEKAKKKKKKAIVHVKIDSGMHRLGVMPEEAVPFVTKVTKTPSVFLEGIFTHFASADEEDLAFTYEQLRVFTRVIDMLSQKGIKPPIIHAANSAATLRIPDSHFNMVRPGKILYGPFPKSSYTLPFIAKPILSLKTKIVQIREVKKDESVGYGRAFIAQKDMHIAALPVGYADGYRRAPQNFGEVLVRGKRVPLIGRVSMDQTSIDVSDIPGAVIGDEVVLIGRQKNEEITAEEIADKIGTINYEVVTSLSARVERKYYE